MSLLSTNIKLLYTSFDLLTERLMPSVTDRLLIMSGILLQHIFLCYSSCIQSIMGFLYVCEGRFVSNLKINILPDRHFKTVFLSG